MYRWVWRYTNPLQQFYFYAMGTFCYHRPIFIINTFNGTTYMSDSQLVYSTETGRIRPEKEDNRSAPKLFKDGAIRIERQTKGRKGKGVMCVVGIDPEQHDLKKLAKTLKSKMGQGGAVKDQLIEIQGDDRQKLKEILASLGFKVKIAGG